MKTNKKLPVSMQTECRPGCPSFLFFFWKTYQKRNRHENIYSTSISPISGQLGETSSILWATYRRRCPGEMSFLSFVRIHNCTNNSGNSWGSLPPSSVCRIRSMELIRNRTSVSLRPLTREWGRCLPMSPPEERAMKAVCSAGRRPGQHGRERCWTNQLGTKKNANGQKLTDCFLACTRG